MHEYKKHRKNKSIKNKNVINKQTENSTSAILTVPVYAKEKNNDAHIVCTETLWKLGWQENLLHSAVHLPETTEIPFLLHTQMRLMYKYITLANPKTI